ncbi:MAG: hypothetical protein IJR91_01240 [Ruminococcus sp.]|nr:hypothetical protein [Ruminococcus sp.]
MPPKSNDVQPARSLKEEGLIFGISKKKYRDLKQRVALRHPEQYPQEPPAEQIDAEYDRMAAVKRFSGDTEQFDDLTMLGVTLV